MSSRKRVPTRKIAVIILVIYLCCCLSLRLGQRKLIFFPSQAIAATPADLQLPYQEISLLVENQKMQAWWIPAKTQKQPKSMLYLHGNSSNMGDELDRAVLLHQLGINLLLIDYRGYGKSEGAFPSEASVYRDAAVAWNYLQQRQIAPEKLYVYGRSLGGAIAIDLAVKHPEMAGVVVEGTFTSIKDTIDYFIPYPLVPVDWILTDRFDSLSKVRSLQTPILLIHGMADRTIPMQMSVKLFAAAPTPKQLLLVPQGEHDNTARVGGKRYLQAIEKAIEQ